MTTNLIIYLLAFAGIWIGAGMAIHAVERLSKTLKLSSFVVSFLLLGFFTSISELSVGVNSLIENNPEIYVGNLIGASIVIFMMIIPLLAITGNGLKVNREFQGFNLLVSVVVIVAPVVLSIDGKIDRYDSLVALIFYLFLLICIQAKRGILQHVTSVNKTKRVRLVQEFFKIIIGIAVIFISSHFVVEQTVYFSEILHISPFLISLLFISIGTNIPELSLVVRSAFLKNNDVAFGDYVGSAAFNTFLFGFLTLIYGDTVYLTNSYVISLVFLITGLVIFYFLAKRDHNITRGEGLILLLLYVGFLLVEVAVGHYL